MKLTNQSVNETDKRVKNISRVLAIVFVIVANIQGYRNIGLPVVLIVGTSGMIAFFIWSSTYLKYPVDPRIILPLFLLTVACLEVHMCEEYLTGFGPAMSRLFDISWTEKTFLMIFAFIGPVIYAMTALGLFYRVPIAGFMAWFIFIGPGIAEFTHFIFPTLRPDLAPDVKAAIPHAVINGTLVTNLRNYFVKTTGQYYFPGMYTAILPMIPGSFAVIKLLKHARKQRVG